MPLTVSSLERQLKSANANMDAYVATLDGADAKQRKRNPKWRNLQSARLQIESRLRSAKAVVAYTEELDQKRVAASAEE
jgi:multidrug resistance efflux pump